MDGHLGNFQVLAISNSTALNILVPVFWGNIHEHSCIWYPIPWQKNCWALGYVCIQHSALVDRFCYTVDSTKVVPLDIRDL